MAACITPQQILSGSQTPAALRQAPLTPDLDKVAWQQAHQSNPQYIALYKDFVNAQKVIRQLRAQADPDPSVMPIEGTRLNQGSLPGQQLLITPAMLNPAGFPNLLTVFTYCVPPGYRGYINYISCEYNGAGFVDGSGSLTFALGVQNYFYPGYGNILTTLGSRTAALWSIDGGLPLLGNQYITWFVTLNNPAVQPGGYVICTFQGWIAPTRKGARP
jgi:hypothetical protein